MSYTFTKLFSSITESTIWCEDSDVRIVWITMLAMADKNGRVFGSIPGLANRAQVPIEKAEMAINRFLSPDKYSRTKDFDGRRIEEIDGGWALLNHAKYRAIRDDEERKAYKREWIAKKRAEEKESVDNVDSSRPQYTQAEADTEAYPLKPNTMSSPKGDNRVPFAKIVDLYHEILPELPKCEILNATRKGYIRQRWQDKNHGLPDIEHWGNFFEYVKKSDFLMGRVQSNNDRAPFRANLEWLTKLSNYTKIYEEKYHG